MIELTFIEKLNRVREKLERLSHIKKYDIAYTEARKIATELYSLLPDYHDIDLDIQILDKYSDRDSDKKKSYVIEEFKKESIIDITKFISRHRKNTDSSIEQ